MDQSPDNSNTPPTEATRMKILVNGTDPWRASWLVELLASLPDHQAGSTLEIDPSSLNPERWAALPPGDVFASCGPFSEDLLQQAEAHHVKILYLTCDVRDAIVSDYYRLRYLQPEVAGSVYPAIRELDIDQACAPEHLTQWCAAARNYPDARRWLHHPQVIAVSYEQMQRNPAEEISRLAAELSLNTSPEAIQAICENRSFEDRWAGELQQKAADAQPPAGTVGIWMHRFKSETLHTLCAQFGELLIQYGYEANSDWTLNFVQEEPFDWIGWVDRCSGSKVMGWARRLSSEEPVEVILYVNDQEVMRILADQFRQDLLDAQIHPEGKCAFVFNIENVIQLNPSDRFRVRPAGAPEDLNQAQKIPEVVYAEWSARYCRLSGSDHSAIHNHIRAFSSQPKISLLMSVSDTPIPFLRETLKSVCHQLYPHWELRIAADASLNPELRGVIDEYREMDSRIRVTLVDAPASVTETLNACIKSAEGEFMAVLNAGDRLTEDALYYFAWEMITHPGLDLIYSDEDRMDREGTPRDPHFKPDFCPDYFLSHNYLGQLTAIRSSLVRQAGGFRKEFGSAREYDLLLRCYRHSGPTKIRHIPRALYRSRVPETPPAAEDMGQKALEDYFRNAGQAVGVTPAGPSGQYRLHYPVPESKPRVSIIIPTRNQKADLEICINRIIQKTDYPNYEILVVDNESDQEDCLHYLDSLITQDTARVIPYPHPFNFSAINNFAAGHAQGDLLCFLNNDTEVISPEWLTEMVSHALRPEIGAVGAKLLYRTGGIQHAGVVTGISGCAGHPFKNSDGASPGQAGRLGLLQNPTCVTAACLVIRREVFHQVQGFDESLGIAFNDVDFCLQVQDAGYRNLWTPQAVLYHYESKSRGYEDTPAKIARLKSEIEYLQKRWGDRLLNDPNYNPNYSLFSEEWDLACPPRTVPPWKDAAPGKARPRQDPESKDTGYLINRGFEFTDREYLFSLKNSDKTLIVVGLARSGTSLLSGVLHHLGVFMGDKANDPVFEDFRLAEALENNLLDEAKAIIQEYNSRYPVWGVKRPSFLNFLQPLKKVTRHPVFLFIFRDIFAISNRNLISMGQNVVSGMETSLREYRKILDFIKTQHPCGLLFSYEKAFEFKEDWVDMLVEDLGIPATPRQKQDALDFISRNSDDYLKSTRNLNIVGYVETVNPHKVSGWARDADSNEPVDVILYHNGKQILQTRANRPHTSSRSSDAAGVDAVAFEFDIQGVLDLKPGDALQVRVLGDMEFLPNASSVTPPQNTD